MSITPSQMQVCLIITCVLTALKRGGRNVTHWISRCPRQLNRQSIRSAIMGTRVPIPAGATYFSSVICFIFLKSILFHIYFWWPCVVHSTTSANRLLVKTICNNNMFFAALEMTKFTHSQPFHSFKLFQQQCCHLLLSARWRMQAWGRCVNVS